MIEQQQKKKESESGGNETMHQGNEISSKIFCFTPTFNLIAAGYKELDDKTMDFLTRNRLQFKSKLGQGSFGTVHVSHFLN